jgi:acetoin utilization protein AcuA
MTSPIPAETTLKTPNGAVRLRSHYRPEEIEQYEFNGQFCVTEDYKPLYTQRESLAKIAAQTDTNVVLALDVSDSIIGYGVLAEPDPQERWSQLGPGLIMELKAIEVSRGWRSVGIAPQIMKLVLEYPRIEDVVVYLVGYSWTWDLEGAHKSAADYRQTLISVFEPFGFQQYETNEPNVCLKPENIFMARIGRKVPKNIRDRFKWLRYDLNMWSWSVG